MWNTFNCLWFHTSSHVNLCAFGSLVFSKTFTIFTTFLKYMMNKGTILDLPGQKWHSKEGGRFGLRKEFTEFLFIDFRFWTFFLQISKNLRDLDLKLGHMEILVILKKINGLNHDFRVHMNRKIEKTGQGSRDVNILYKISWLIQRLYALCKCLTIHEELKCKIWPHSFYWHSKEFERFGSRKWAPKISKMTHFYVLNFYEYLKI